jgi:hypothetical protein
LREAPLADDSANLLHQDRLDQMFFRISHSQIGEHIAAAASR